MTLCSLALLVLLLNRTCVDGLRAPWFSWHRKRVLFWRQARVSRRLKELKWEATLLPDLDSRRRANAIGNATDAGVSHFYM
jgi:hypothetical protein